MRALGVLLGEPAIQVVLVQLIQRDPVTVEPVQELEVRCMFSRTIAASLQLCSEFQTHRVQRPQSNSMGRVLGPLKPLSGFHGAGPVRRALGMRRDMTVKASVSSSRARCAPRQ
jgi:hypothetical protein